MKGELISTGEAIELPHNSSDEEADGAELVLVDENTCSTQELDSVFQVKYKIADESAVSLKNDYVLHMVADSGFTLVAAGLSSGAVCVFDINAGRSLQHSTLTDIQAPVTNERTPICGVRFLDDSPNCILAGSSHGLVRLFDLRTQKEQARFDDNTECKKGISNFGEPKDVPVRRKINCFDTNSNSRILCTGTEQCQGDVFLLFYDIRERRQLGGYYECHQNDITALRFHSTNPDILCSGSTDGLINVYDIREAKEDDALFTTINTGTSVHKLNWHKNVYEQDLISCITHTNDFHVYLSEESDVVAKFERCQITDATKRTSEANCNVVDAHSLETGDIFLLAGTNNNKGEIMRSLRLGKDLLPMADFIGNKQIVRASIFHQKSSTIVTGGESGLVTLWAPENSTNDGVALASCSSALKHKNKKTKKNTPY